eukprot:1891318-Rhodomonas_salina.3
MLSLSAMLGAIVMHARVRCPRTAPSQHLKDRKKEKRKKRKKEEKKKKRKRTFSAPDTTVLTCGSVPHIA